MTYIISGISNGRTFLMSDCVGTDKKDVKSTYKYINKINRLISSENETYFCHTGIDTYSYAINLFDRQCFEAKIQFDIKSKQQMLEVMDIFKYLKIYYNKTDIEISYFGRIYFVERGVIYYYNIDNDGIFSQMQTLSEGYYIEPDGANNSPIVLRNEIVTNEEILTFCKKRINKIQEYGIDLKNRFSYILFDDNDSIFNNSIKNNEELVLALIPGDYDKLK
jgi:hypothetical protein